MSIATIPPVNNPKPFVPPDTLDDDNANDTEDKSSKDDKSSNKDSLQGGILGTQGEIGLYVPEEKSTEGKDQGVYQSRCKNKRTTVMYADYGLMMNTQRQARGGQCQATIYNGLIFFSAEDLSNTKANGRERI